MTLLCTSVLSPLFILHAKWYSGNRSRDSKYNSSDSKQNIAPYGTLELRIFLGILWKLQIKYFSETFLDDYFKLTSDIYLKSVPQLG